MLYAWFYFIAFTVTFPILLYDGFKRKFPWVSWLFLILIGKLVFIIGSKAGTFTRAAWISLFSYFHLPEAPGKSALGGLFAIIIFILIVKILFNPRLSILDPFAITLPVALSIQRFGCLFTGCCYGTRTDIPWSVSYPYGSNVFNQQLQEGIIDFSATQSLQIHPYPIYLIIGGLLIFFVVFRFRSRLKAEGNLFLLSVSLVFFLRFITDFLRGSAIRGITVKLFPGLSFSQILLLVVSVVLLSVVVKRENKWKSITKNDLPPFKAKPWKNVLFLIVAINLLWFMQNWLQPLELIVLMFFLIPASVGTILEINQQISVPQAKWVAPVAVLICFVFIAQTGLENTRETRESYNTLSFGVLAGGYESYEGGCDNSGYVKRNFTTVGIDYTRHYFSGKSKFREGKFRIGFSAGGDKVNLISGYTSPFEPESKNIYELRLLYHYDWRYFGFGIGAGIGKLYVAEDEASSPFIPQFDLRVGPRSIFYGEVNFLSHQPSGLPSPYLKYGVGTGFGRLDGTNLMIGGTEYQFPYISGSFLIGKKLMVSPFFAFGNGDKYDYVKFYPTYSLTLHYNFK